MPPAHPEEEEKEDEGDDEEYWLWQSQGATERLARGHRGKTADGRTDGRTGPEFILLIGV